MLVAFVAAATALSVQPGANVLVVGNGGVQILAARLAALRGYETTLALAPQFMTQTEDFIYDDNHPKGSLPLKLMAIAGDAADAEKIDQACAAADALIVAFDNEKQFLPEPALNVFMPEGSNVKRVCMMSRYLNGRGMGFTVKAAKLAANAEIWSAEDDLVSQFKSMEAAVTKRAKEIGAGSTIIRAGTLKGGASGDALSGGSGEAMFLNPKFYSVGQQDVANWRLLFDCGSLGVRLSKGDTLPGPGFMAAMTATGLGSGDSHRGAVAMSLVEALRSEAAEDADFSLASEDGREFPKEAEWPSMFENAK
mmetsp:Transcript_25494/g.64806  ORF Transcript_25494/g.64806 Transcript_25494/m.64806 type:complete len:309 (+) Transcript_25494:39-965(+)|eukprot:CAMPEP_0115863226 /NCGR_PEP_ID=MMETSP0287-20121206/18583_1 /TAXON_ID=412157 /ORGANISM="Chrysochromulina rotalis, Strain UIO044" /LENGTH=308 /DNA_ID=CAMNT_0003317673 /DNA_START=21 /DNA_END=947 /DNA_ORIENTATION=+